MKITLIQTNIQWGEAEQNRKEAERLMKEAEGSELYVLPEMWNTGFATNPEGMAEEEEEGESLRWMRKMARQTNAAVAGSMAVRCSDGTYRNRFYFVKPVEEHVEQTEELADGQGTGIEFYDKHHLFSYGGEDLNYRAGKERVVVEWRGVRFLLMVCYDLRFPVWSRNHEDYDCILYVASWPTSRIRVWQSLLVARAIENQCYVAGVNRVGNDPQCSYNGSTMMVDAYGRITAQCLDNEQQSVTTDIDLAALEAFRRKFPVLKDRD